jgi:histone H3/H4
MSAARQLRTMRLQLRSRLEALHAERRTVTDRDLSREARAREHGRIDTDMRAAFAASRTRAESTLAEARKAAARLTPAALQRDAILEDPQRFAALTQALGQVAAAELPRIAELASDRDDFAALAALAVQLGRREDLPQDVGQFITAATRRAVSGLDNAVQDLAVATSELAGLIGEYTQRADDESLLREMVTVARAATAFTVDGHDVRMSDEQLGDAFVALGIARQTGPVEMPNALPGTIAPPPVS